MTTAVTTEGARIKRTITFSNRYMFAMWPNLFWNSSLACLLSKSVSVIHLGSHLKRSLVKWNAEKILLILLFFSSYYMKAIYHTFPWFISSINQWDFGITLEKLVNHSPSSRDSQSLLVFFQHPAWFIEPINHRNVWYIGKIICIILNFFPSLAGKICSPHPTLRNLSLPTWFVSLGYGNDHYLWLGLVATSDYWCEFNLFNFLVNCWRFWRYFADYLRGFHCHLELFCSGRSRACTMSTKAVMRHPWPQAYHPLFVWWAMHLWWLCRFIKLAKLKPKF